MIKSEFNAEEITSRNKKAVLTYLRKYGSSSRKTIAVYLDLTTATLTNIVNDLIRDGFVLELGALTEGKVGRKHISIDLNPNRKIALGLEIGNKKVSFTAINLRCRVLQTKEWTLEKREPELVLEEVIEYIEKYIEKKHDKIQGIGVLVPGYIENGISKNTKFGDIKAKIEERLKIKAYIENNIRALVGAELYLERKFENFWLVSYGPGVGSAIVLNGEVLKGNKQKSGEIGHIPISNSIKKRECPICNQIGCLESEIHFDTIKNQLKSEGIEKNSDETDVEFFVRTLKKTNYLELKQNLDILAQYVSMGFSLLDPEKIILSGEIFSVPEFYKYMVTKIHEYNGLISGDNIEYMGEHAYKRSVAGAVLVLSNFF